jgi:acyl-CoA synthetase (AMP-forming)/AMP-acid ligase II
VTTSDLGRIDGDGFITITGRMDDAIVRGGFKVLPAEIERVLEAHPAVRAAGVVGKKDGRAGAVPVAAVELSSPVDTQELLQWCRARLARYQIPAEIRVVRALPRTSSLKVAKPQLRELFDL